MMRYERHVMKSVDGKPRIAGPAVVVISVAWANHQFTLDEKYRSRLDLQVATKKLGNTATRRANNRKHSERVIYLI
jgi:hypothetical protein